MDTLRDFFVLIWSLSISFVIFTVLGVLCGLSARKVMDSVFWMKDIVMENIPSFFRTAMFGSKREIR